MGAVTKTSFPSRHSQPNDMSYRISRLFREVGLSSSILVVILSFSSGAMAQTTETGQGETAIGIVRNYVHALSTSNPVAVAQQDFVCLLKMLRDNLGREDSFGSSLENPIYTWCWKRLILVHAEARDSRDRGLDELWPGKEKLVNFKNFKRLVIAESEARQLPPSYFVMEHIGSTPGSVGFTLEPMGTAPLPHASFQIGKDDLAIAVPTTLVRMKVHYTDPIHSPVANASGQKNWAVLNNKPLRPVKAVVTKWVVLSDLKQYGFPTDTAVLNIPLETSAGSTVPFVLEAGGYMLNTTEWWQAEDVPNALNAAIIRAQAFPDRRERILLLNRVLAVDPRHQMALKAISRELYEGLLAYGARLHGIEVSNSALAQRLNELYWTIQAQTDRMDLALHMGIGRQAEPTPADYLYRMIPAMERLSDLQPGDFENQLRLSLAYRWSHDQLTAIMAPQQLLTEVPSGQMNRRARVLLELAWSRVSKVAWTRHVDDPDIVKGYEEATEAYELTKDPMDKFLAAYTQAYSLAFWPNRDNHVVLAFLQEARRWYEQLPGATLQSWRFLLRNETLQNMLETDPSFQALLGDIVYSDAELEVSLGRSD